MTAANAIGSPNNGGFTLIELIITVAIASILLAQSIPGFRQGVASSRQTASINQLAGDVHLARSEAIKRGVRTVLCTSTDATSCNRSGRWDEGYILFTDQDGDRFPGQNDAILQIDTAAPAEVNIRSSAARSRLTFQPTGMSPGSNVTITFCTGQGEVAPKALIISNTGRPRTSTTAPNGDPLNCSPTY